jgi:hypothetical protein
MAVDAAGAGAEASGAAAGKKRFEARCARVGTFACVRALTPLLAVLRAGEEVERRGGVELVHLHGHVRHLPQLAARAVDRVPSQPDERRRRGALYCLGRLRPRVPPGLHLQVAAHALQLPAVQQGVGVRQDREGAAKHATLRRPRLSPPARAARALTRSPRDRRSSCPSWALPNKPRASPRPWCAATAQCPETSGAVSVPPARLRSPRARRVLHRAHQTVWWPFCACGVV